MMLALARVVAGLARSASSLAVTLPVSATAMWMLLVCRTPPTSDLFDAPDLSFLRVVSLLPNACRNAKGNSSRSKGVAAKAVTASSISTAFLRSHLQIGRASGRERVCQYVRMWVVDVLLKKTKKDM